MNKDKIIFSKSMALSEMKLAIETAMLKGFLSVSALFPVTEDGKKTNINEQWEKLKLEFNKQNEDNIVHENYTSVNSQAKLVQDFDFRKNKGLETIFQIGPFLKDENNDFLPDKNSFKIYIPENAGYSTYIAAANFAFRMGMELTSYEGPILAKKGYKGNIITFVGGNKCEMQILKDGEYSILEISGEDNELKNFINFVCEHFPYVDQQMTWNDELQYLAESFAMKTPDGQLAYALAETKEETETVLFGSPELSSIESEKFKNDFTNIKIENYKGNKLAYEREYDLPWEVSILRDLLKTKLYPEIRKGDSIRIESAISEDRTVRNNLANEIKEKIGKLGAYVESTEIICAYKQGYSWIEEIILPKLKEENIGNIEIAFKPFLPPGENEWNDEGGAIPTYNNVGGNNLDNWYDLPIRFLQELYPVRDLIAERLEINKEQIKFVTYDDEEDITYRWKAFDKLEHLIQEESYKVSYSERPYLDEFKEMGKVHPLTGYLKIWVNDYIFLNERIATDVENIWEVFQNSVLPECKDFVEKKTDGNPSISKQPFFSQLKLTVNASEPNRLLESREDMISSLDALHEDMYFVGTDYFKSYGLAKCGEIFDAPGLILPVIHKKYGKPTFRVQLFEQIKHKPCVYVNNTKTAEAYSRNSIDCFIERLVYKEGKLVPYIRIKGVDCKFVEAYTKLWNGKYLFRHQNTEKVGYPTFCVDDKEFSVETWETKKLNRIQIEDVDIMENKLIGYEQYIEIIEQLKHVDGLFVYQIATSYEGRKIYAVELKSKDEGYISKTKRITYLPSEIINCRHHANEVASTNSAFMLIKKLLTDNKYKNIAEKMNIVIVPMENTDGAAIHYELQKDNPHWKFHVARFNAIGKEFYHEYFAEDTIHTEAKAFKWLWRNYLPDVVVDNHGVPSHEWEQQFSGYTSPSYKGFWLPRSLLYGYFWTVKGESFKDNYRMNKKLEDVVANAINKDKEMKRWNEEWIKEFEAYAHQWMPKLFPANYYKEMITYWIPFDFESNAKYTSARFPWITSVAYTSEVADETAQGEYLNLCARAHVTHDTAMIDALLESDSVYKSAFLNNGGKIYISWIRQRPLIINHTIV